MEIDKGVTLAKLCLEQTSEVCGAGGNAACKKLETIQKKVGRKLVDGSSTVAGVVLRRDLDWRREGKKRNFIWRDCRE